MIKGGTIERALLSPLFERTVETIRSRGVVRGLWSLDREAPSLGGMLVLRGELELLARACGVGRIALSFYGSDKPGVAAARNLVGEVFQSRYPFGLEEYRSGPGCWPTGTQLRSKDFSYQYLDRCTALFHQTGCRPSLAWSDGALRLAGEARGKFRGRLYTAHLKQVPDAGQEESNADLAGWFEFFSNAAIPGKTEFLLLGADRASREISRLPGIHVARNLGLPLSTQLALVGLADGFIGMTSGVCAAAILSDVPYLLLKHPGHHVEEMQRQIGSGDAFAFATGRQRIWRSADSVDTLTRGFEFMRGGEE